MKFKFSQFTNFNRPQQYKKCTLKHILKHSVVFQMNLNVFYDLKLPKILTGKTDFQILLPTAHKFLLIGHVQKCILKVCQRTSKV